MHAAFLKNDELLTVATEGDDRDASRAPLYDAAVDFDPESLIDPAWPVEVAELRTTLWPVVNWLMPLRLEPADEGGADYLALRPQLLARAPVAGEWLYIPRHRARIERVEWTEDGRVIGRLQDADVEPSYLEDLERAGWQVFPRHDADEWLRRITEE